MCRASSKKTGRDDRMPLLLVLAQEARAAPLRTLDNVRFPIVLLELMTCEMEKTQLAE